MPRHSFIQCQCMWVELYTCIGENPKWSVVAHLVCLVALIIVFVVYGGTRSGVFWSESCFWLVEGGTSLLGVF